MSNIKIEELNTNSLNEINEQEIKEVVGGLNVQEFITTTITTNNQTSTQALVNEAVSVAVGGFSVVDQDGVQLSVQSIG